MRTGKTETMETVVPKPRKGGRPATGRDPLVQVRLPKFMLERIDHWAGRFPDMDRSKALRCLLGIGLESSRSKATDLKRFKVHHAKRKDVPPRVPRHHDQVKQAPAGRRRLVLIKNGALS